MNKTTTSSSLTSPPSPRALGASKPNQDNSRARPAWPPCAAEAAQGTPAQAARPSFPPLPPTRASATVAAAQPRPTPRSILLLSIQMLRARAASHFRSTAGVFHFFACRAPPPPIPTCPGTPRIFRPHSRCRPRRARSSYVSSYVSLASHTR